MKRSKLTAVPGLFLLLFAGSAIAQDVPSQSSFADPFDLGAGAASAVMAGTVAAPGSVWSLNYNPAGLSNVKQTTVGFSHLKWTLQQSASFVGAAFENGAALAVSYIDQGSVDEEDGNGLTGSQKSGTDVGIMGGYGFRLPIDPDIAIGMSAQAVQRSLADDRATWAAANIGAQWDAAPGVATVGVLLENIGSSVRLTSNGPEEPQPTAISGGVNFRIPPGLIPQGAITLGGDVRKVRFRDVALNVGGEILFANTLAARAGWMSDADEGKFTVGAGFKYSNFNIDYGFRDMDVLGITHRISVTMGFAQ